jgi:hypothetical protein
VLKKLSALRVTLNEEDKQILDVLIMGEEAEVEAHVKKGFMGPEANVRDPDEVNAHVMRPAPEANVREPGAVVLAKVLFDRESGGYVIR